MHQFEYAALLWNLYLHLHQYRWDTPCSTEKCKTYGKDWSSKRSSLILHFCTWSTLILFHNTTPNTALTTFKAGAMATWNVYKGYNEFLVFLARLARPITYILAIDRTHFCIISWSRDTLVATNLLRVFWKCRNHKRELLSNRRCRKFLEVTMKLDLTPKNVIFISLPRLRDWVAYKQKVIQSFCSQKCRPVLFNLTSLQPKSEKKHLSSLQINFTV